MMVVAESLRETIHSTAAAIRELKREYYEDLESASELMRPSARIEHIYALLSKEETSKALLSAVNAVLKRYDEPSVDKITAYDILILDEILQEEEFCQRCRDPRVCPFRGLRVRPEVTSQGIFAKEFWCERHYRVYLIDDIQRLAQTEIVGLEAKSTRELTEMRNKLKEKVKR